MSIFNEVSASNSEDRNYPYYKYIKSPEQLGSSSKGNLEALSKDVVAVKSYVGVLVSGNTKAHIGGIGPLGNKYFMDTGTTCKDSNGINQKRYVFINNIPDGDIPIVSDIMGESMPGYKGLVPGVMGSASYINPFKLFSAFSADTNCQEITMETRDISNRTTTESKYVTKSDIKSYNPCWFPSRVNPVNGKKCKEGMCVKRDKGVQLYTTGIGLLGIYILYELLFRKRANS